MICSSYSNIHSPVAGVSALCLHEAAAAAAGRQQRHCVRARAANSFSLLTS